VVVHLTSIRGIINACFRLKTVSIKSKKKLIFLIFIFDNQLNNGNTIPINLASGITKIYGIADNKEQQAKNVSFRFSIVDYKPSQ